ncbi:Major Facilitator Superfamily protein [Micromonospora coriariae]|uniref:Major Facilitator Superfamily protein n=1 Tax=Micromonospora coriariae TaxID=285665 RepID=A0A1C4VVX6_9ACTN|nr:MFS transporter [Micromonospora coriariae]SCE88127.1 Major Facilitator Superfamily protein [Micromonospora coriariae]
MTAPVPSTANQIPPYGPRSVVIGDRPQVLRPVWLLIGPTLAASLGAFLLAVAVGPQWGAIQRDMDLPTSAVLWIFVAYLLPAVLAVAVGALVGRRWPTVVALLAIALLVLGSLLTALASGGALLLLGRAVTGFGAGLAWGVTAMLVTQMAARRVWVTSLVAGAVVLALGLGPAAGVLVGRAVGWRWPFMLAVPFGAVALLATAVCGIVVLIQGASRPAQPQATFGQTMTPSSGRPSDSGMAAAGGKAAGLLLVTVDGVKQVATDFFGMDLVQEVARLLGSENIRSTRLGTDLTLWHAEDSPGRARPGQPNPAASLLAAEHGSPPVTGPAVLTGPILHGTSHPLDADAADRIANRLRG